MESVLKKFFFKLMYFLLSKIACSALQKKIIVIRSTVMLFVVYLFGSFCYVMKYLNTLHIFYSTTKDRLFNWYIFSVLQTRIIYKQQSNVFCYKKKYLNTQHIISLLDTENNGNKISFCLALLWQPIVIF